MAGESYRPASTSTDAIDVLLSRDAELVEIIRNARAELALVQGQIKVEKRKQKFMEALESNLAKAANDNTVREFWNLLCKGPRG
jgi:hypothetical protein